VTIAVLIELYLFLLVFCLGASWYIFRQKTAWGWFPLAIAVLLTGYGVFFTSIQTHPTGTRTNPAVVTIPKGTGMNAIARLLAEQGVTSEPAYLTMLGQLLGVDRKLKAGDYEIPAGLSHYDLLKTLTEGHTLLYKVTFPEGIRAGEFAALLSEAGLVDPERFLALVADSLYCREAGIPHTTADGFLMPETYFFQRGLDEKEIFHTLTQPVLDFLNAPATEAALSARDFTPLNLVTLASIIEGEAMHDEERPLVSAVYHNRLRRGIPLQADPTIQFIIDGPPRRLLLKDLTIDSPYNTYRHRGLPPGPINNPGLASLRAALYPADVTYLYFVARGDGYHTFSNNQSEHLAAKRKFDQIRRNVAREKNGI
jgi:UPF0755 protein